MDIIINVPQIFKILISEPKTDKSITKENTICEYP